MKMFQPGQIGCLTLRNRLIRSGTFEGACDGRGYPLPAYFELYGRLAQSGVAAIITGFSYISQKGRAMHIGQAGLDSSEKVQIFKQLTDEVHKNNTLIFFQIAHSGRQTRQIDTGAEVVGVSSKRSLYYLQKPRVLNTNEIYDIADEFASAAFNAMLAGFDGIQLHGAHGYLIHQFLLPAINNRKDEFGIDSKKMLGTKFLDAVIDSIRKKCGDSFPILIKISCSDNYFKKFSVEQYTNFIKFLDSKKIAAIEISCGTMDYALNIFRGKLPVDVVFKKNPIFKTDNLLLKFLLKCTLVPFLKYKTKKFSYNYNLDFSKLAKQYTDIPVICVGGFRKGLDIEAALKSKAADFISMSRPFLADISLVGKIRKDISYVSPCTNCNICAIMCDSGQPVKCYRRIKKQEGANG